MLVDRNEGLKLSYNSQDLYNSIVEAYIEVFMTHYQEVLDYLRGEVQ